MEPIIVSKILHKNVKTSWSAITELDQMVLWFFDNIPAFKAEVGFTTSFTVSSGERDFLHVWEITEVIPQQKIVYKWQYPMYYNGYSLVTFLLESISTNQTKIKVIAEGIEKFPQEIPEFTRESCQNGWHYFMDRLQHFVENE